MAPMASLLSPISPRSSSILVSHRFLIRPSTSFSRSTRSCLTRLTLPSRQSVLLQLITFKYHQAHFNNTRIRS
ncbi:hypothetical protein H4Q26_008010 [Puccinia striiformis f. sp. tritici PST-130]|nr:hypothetical protein H4Q26_008010 [Puccinia striiformis f. sp. tritici PST-130]